MSRRAIYLIVLALCGCAETGQARVDVPLFVAGTEISEPVVAVGGAQITVERADLAFGPLYLCAGFTAGDLCDTARLEWLEAIVVDTTAQAAVRAGALSGITGSVQSWMYDLGISSQLTRAEPFVLDAAADLGGASFVVAGRANVAGVEIPWRASVPIEQAEETELGVPVIRKSTSEAFSHEVQRDEPGLLVRFDAAPWLQSIDFRPYVEDASCTAGGPAVVCAGAIEQTCAADGSVVSTRDCRALGQACLAGRGCADALTIDPGSAAFRALRNALVSGGRPAFEWDFAPSTLR